MNFNDKIVLVTGGTGFLGKVLIKRLLSMGAVIRVLARNEGKLIELKTEYPSIQIFTGDIANLFDVQQAMKNVNAVFHLAASKHIGIAEHQVRECVNSNIIGSMNILDTSMNFDICPECELVIGISTDKAAQVSGVYGASKLLMERLFSQYERLNQLCKYRIVRYGNVLYSTGSVLCKWKRALEMGDRIYVTDLTATRFYWTVDSAIDHIFSCLQYSNDSEPYIPKMKSMSLFNLLKAMYYKYSPNPNDFLGFTNSDRVIYTGLQNGENKHEVLTSGGYHSGNAEQYSVAEISDMI